MGKATIVGGGDKGNYTIKMDYGTATRDATVAALAQHLTELATKITEAQTKLDAAKAAEAEKKTAAQKATNDYIAATQAIPKAFEDVSSAMDAVENLAASATATPEERKAAQDALTAAEAAYTAAQDAAKEALSEQTKAATALVEAKKKTAPLQLALDALVDEQTKLQKDKAYWEGLQLESTLQAWCADYTENGSGEVATMEIPGENQIVLIKPGAPAGNTVDGVLVAREVQSPEQVFFNAAILPGWQKFKPTYRSGVITALNTSNNTASVTLDAAQSSAAGLDINKMTALANVPVVYMTCHAAAFEAGDRCVVRFNGMDWAQPQVVGFVDNPKPCLPSELWITLRIRYYMYEIEVGQYLAATLVPNVPYGQTQIYDAKTYSIWQHRMEMYVEQVTANAFIPPGHTINAPVTTNDVLKTWQEQTVPNGFYYFPSFRNVAGAAVIDVEKIYPAPAVSGSEVSVPIFSGIPDAGMYNGYLYSGSNPPNTTETSQMLGFATANGVPLTIYMETPGGAQTAYHLQAATGGAGSGVEFRRTTMVYRRSLA